MRYSVLMPYYMRSSQLEATLRSFDRLYANRNDYEVLIIEDTKNAASNEEHIALMYAINERKNIRIIDAPAQLCPAKLYNLGAEEALGDYLVITNPECMHVVNLFFGMDYEFEKDPHIYIVCACMSASGFSVQGSFTPESWYQHSVHRNARLHFCSAISKEDYWRVGGFSEMYSDGVCFDDDDFRNKIDKAVIRTICRDDLLVVHLPHKKPRPDNFKHLYLKNKILYNSVWGSSALKAEDIQVKRVAE